MPQEPTNITVSENALRELVREALDGGHLGDLTLPEDEQGTGPVNVSSVVDPSAAETDIMDPNYLPQTKQELDVAIKHLVRDMPVDKVPTIYRTVKDVVDAGEQQEDEDEMTKKAEQGGHTDRMKVGVEEAIRKEVRRMLSEISPSWSTDLSHSGTDFGDTHSDEDDDEEEEQKKSRTYKTTAIGNMDDVGGATFDQIAKDLGFSIAGAKRAVDYALEKARFVATMDDDEKEIVVLTCMNDYIKSLAKSGELTAADVQLLKDHPDIVRTLDGFREFLHNTIRKLRKGDAKLEDPLGEADEAKPATTKAKGDVSGKDVEVDWGGMEEAAKKRPKARKRV